MIEDIRTFTSVQLGISSDRLREIADELDKAQSLIEVPKGKVAIVATYKTATTAIEFVLFGAPEDIH